MNQSISSKLAVFLSVDQQSMATYFNNHDPAPMYKRQLNHAFEQYIMTSIRAVKRYTELSYKICYKTEMDKEYIDPLVYAIKGHFSERKLAKQAEFEKFKRRTYLLLFVSLGIVMACQCLIPFLIGMGEQLHSSISNSLEVFSWVILWRPIDSLIFDWNPYLKEISIMDRLANAEIILVQNED
jgi:hypothetical protein